eukprot:TRINITY_DN2050_c1_g1_i1.p1 TRINITY_DN2050_c1_g1~~TRINITY_DN2050_c1_g1_i1.p1  ORF type:complete len:622 (+),score=181.66 TRINITY_DN2050_c1_g1_i1:96-1961(+)
MAVPAFNFHTEELVQFSFELRLDNLGKILQEMATAVQNCTKKCAELGSEVFQLRKQIQTQQERTREGLLQEEVSRERVRGQVEKLKDEMRRMETSFITVKEFDNRIRILHQNHQTLSDRLTETETTGGKKIISHIESFVRRHVREWYEPVRADEVKDLLSRLADLQQNVTSSFRSESAQLDDRLSMHINEVQDRAMVDVASANSARERAVATIQQTRDQDMQQVNASIRTVDETQRKNLKEVQQKAHERFTEVEVRVSALYHGQCFDEEDFREIYDEHVKFRQAPGCEGGLHELVDRRVDVLHNTRPFLELRAKVQRDIGHRLNQVKEEDQDDFARQITEIQRELRAKVSAQRVREIVEENTDRSLYESVDYVKARVQIIDDDKVSHATFIEALRSKGDTKALEQKADRVVVTQLFDFLRNRVDGLAKQPAAGWGEPAYDLQEDQEERQKPQPQQRALPLQLTEGPPTEDSTLAVRLVESAENPQSSALASLLPQPPQPRPPPPPPPAPPPTPPPPARAVPMGQVGGGSGQQRRPLTNYTRGYVYRAAPAASSPRSDFSASLRSFTAAPDSRTAVAMHAANTPGGPLCGLQGVRTAAGSSMVRVWSPLPPRRQSPTAGPDI